MITPGQIVETMTVSGELIICRVVEPADQTYPPGTWLLDSPAHGHQIARRTSELMPVKNHPGAITGRQNAYNGPSGG